MGLFSHQLLHSDKNNDNTWILYFNQTKLSEAQLRWSWLITDSRLCSLCVEVKKYLKNLLFPTRLLKNVDFWNFVTNFFHVKEFFLILNGFPTLDWKPSKGDNIGSIIFYIYQHMTESKESIAFYMFFGTSTVFILHDKSYIDKIIKNYLKLVPYSMADSIRVYFILPILVSL